MVRRIFERLAPERQREILSVAAAEFGKSGFQGTSYNRLLTRVGLGKGSAYYYFADKQDLFLTVVRACYRSFFDSLKDVQRPADAKEYWAFVEAVTLRGLEFMRHDPTSAALLQCFARERQRLDVLSSKDVFEEVEGYYVELVTRGQKLGAVRRDVPFTLLTDLARALSSAFDQWFIATASRASQARLEQLAALFAELSRRLLEPPPPRAGEKPKRRKRATPAARRA